VVAGGFPYPEVPVNISVDTYTASVGAGQVLIAQMPSKDLRLWTLGENGVTKDVLLADPPDYGDNSSFAIDSALQRVAWPLGLGADSGRNFLGIWDSQSGRRVATIDAAGPIATANGSIVFSPDGRRVAFRMQQQNGLVQVCDIGTGKNVFSLQAPGSVRFVAVRYTPDGRRLVTGDDEGGIHVWDATNGALLRSSHHHRASVNRFDYSPDRRSYSSLSIDGSAQVWDAATDEPVGSLLEQNRTGARANFSPDGTRITIPSYAGTAQIWDVQTGLPVTELNGEDDQAGITVFTPDGRFVVSNPGSNTAVRGYVRVRAVPPTGSGRTPDWLLTLGTICAQSRLTDEGRLVGAMDEFAKIADVQRALASAPADDPYAEWGRWILSDRPDRSIGPGFTITPAEAAERAKETPSADGW
jgi:WD40 repeat protein